MFDRIFFPALVFVVLVGATAAFAHNAQRANAPTAQQTVVQLERVIVTRHDVGAAAVAAATETQRATALR